MRQLCCDSARGPKNARANCIADDHGEAESQTQQAQKTSAFFCI
jgi:hypothetical protein